MAERLKTLAKNRTTKSSKGTLKSKAKTSRGSNMVAVGAEYEQGKEKKPTIPPAPATHARQNPPTGPTFGFIKSFATIPALRKKGEEIG